jgi:hypothetical protein
MVFELVNALFARIVGLIVGIYVERSVFVVMV